MSIIEQAKQSIKAGAPRAEEVATEAGVSFRTVERFISENGHLRPIMEKRILDAVGRLLVREAAKAVPSGR